MSVKSDHSFIDLSHCPLIATLTFQGLGEPVYHIITNYNNPGQGKYFWQFGGFLADSIVI